MKYHLLRAITLTLILCVSTSMLADVEIYKETDPSGKVIYTDKPKSQSAEKIEVKDINTIPRPTITETESNQTANSGELPESETTKIPIFEAKITFPPQNYIAYVSGQDFSIKARVQPKLAASYKLLLRYNGQTSESFVIKRIPPGSHSVIVLVADKDGAIVAQSPAVNFTVKLRRIDKPRYRP